MKKQKKYQFHGQGLGKKSILIKALLIVLLLLLPLIFENFAHATNAQVELESSSQQALNEEGSELLPADTPQGTPQENTTSATIAESTVRNKDFSRKLFSLTTSGVLGGFDYLKDQATFSSDVFFEIVNPLLLSSKMEERYQLVSGVNGEITYQSSIVSGDSVGLLLNEWINISTMIELVEQSKDVYPLTSIKVKQPYYVVLGHDNSFKRFEYEINKSEKFILQANADGFEMRKESIHYDIELVYVQGKIQDNFYNAVLDSGEGVSFAFQLADVFSYDIDFSREVKKGDTFTALVEKRFRNGESMGYSRILAASFNNNGSTHQAYLYHDAANPDKNTYYDEKGEALQKAFLRSPVNFTRISSGYTMNRRHPILGITRPHQGIDYAAPMGTPVVAVGDGTVSFAGNAGGYGKLIKVNHIGGLMSQYAHLSRYAKGIRSGTKVQQGEIIGYVGSTGLSTGPHLDFRIKKNGKFVNPDKIIIPSKPPLAPEELEKYQLALKEIENLIADAKTREQYSAELWLNKKEQ